MSIKTIAKEKVLVFSFWHVLSCGGCTISEEFLRINNICTTENLYYNMILYCFDLKRETLMLAMLLYN